MGVIVGTETYSYGGAELEIGVFFEGFEDFNFEVVWALKDRSFENYWGMARIAFDDRVTFELDIVGFSDYFFEFVQILGGLLLELIWWLNFPIESGLGIGKLLRFQ